MSSQPVKVTDVRPGMDLDLEGDKYADPENDLDGLFVYEFATVMSVIRETPGCVLIHFENAGDFGFPPDHEVRVSEESAARAELYAVDDGNTHVVGEQYEIIGWFGSAEEAAEWVGTLPGHETGRYGITGPSDDE